MTKGYVGDGKHTYIHYKPTYLRRLKVDRHKIFFAPKLLARWFEDEGDEPCRIDLACVPPLRSIVWWVESI